MKWQAAGWIDIKAGEGPMLILSFSYFLLLLSSYYIVRPLRDALAASVDAYNYLSTAVFLTMLAIAPAFGWLVSHVSRRRLLPALYLFFIADLVAFAVSFQRAPTSHWVGGAFYVWVTVFNLFVVSVFWSFMADIWREEQARRLFGIIAAGGSAGGFLGPVLTRSLVPHLGISGIALVAALLLSGCVGCLVLLGRNVHARAATSNEIRHGSWRGFTLLFRSALLRGIATLVVIYSFIAMFMYIRTGRLALAEFPEIGARTRFFSQIDLWTNAFALALQLLVVGQIAKRAGGIAVLMLVGVALALCFIPIVFFPTLAVLAAINVVRRAMEFGLAKPARDMLYTVVDAEKKYKAKNVIDTTLYRGADMTATWMHGLLAAAGMTLSALGVLAAILALLTVAISLSLGKEYRELGGK